MALFSRKQPFRDNRIENSGHWPIRLTDFFLVDDYEFPPSHYDEIFFVRDGHFLHETDNGTQAVREGTAMVYHPSSHHVIKQPEQVRLTRVRFLPEWFAPDFGSVMGSPDVLSLFFARGWFELPIDTNLQIFTTRESRQPFLDAAFEFLGLALGEGRHAEPIARVTLLQVMTMLGDEYGVYWRGGNRLAIPDEVRTSLDLIERSVASRNRLPLKQLQDTSGNDQEEISQALRKTVGLTLADYVQRRRLHHAARELLETSTSPEAIAADFFLGGADTFAKNFELAFGLPPEVYREKFGPAEEPAAGAPPENPVDPSA